MRGKEALFAANSGPTGGRRPCPSGDAGALRASTAEIRGAFPRKNDLERFNFEKDETRGGGTAPSGPK